MPLHHKVFNEFGCLEGERTPEFPDVDFLGVRTRTYYPDGSCYSEGDVIVNDYPPFNEEYFEWIDVLESVKEAHDEFVMIELGAGYGTWLVRAALAVRRYHRILPFLLVGVEGEPTHFQWMEQHFHDNGLDPGEHRLFNGAVSDQDGKALFSVGTPGLWRGQSIVNKFPKRFPKDFYRWLQVKLLGTWSLHKVERDYWTGNRYTIRAQAREVSSISLNTLLSSLRKVDLIDLDVQGMEYQVLGAAREQLQAKVKRVHIGTHGRDIERRLRRLFKKLGWKKINDYPCKSDCSTPHGVIKFHDGVQSWLNPKH